MGQRLYTHPSRSRIGSVAVPTASVARLAISRPVLSRSLSGGHDIRHVALSASRAGQIFRVQRAMSVSQPGDPSEVEADRVADAVMRMHTLPTVSRNEDVAREMPEEEELQMQRDKSVQREAPEEEELQMKREDGLHREAVPEEEEMQMKRSSSADVENGADVSHIVTQGLSGGQPLDSATRAFMEPRLGQDLSGIRVHTGTNASTSAEQVNARAYAVGGDIAFRDGEYNPGTSAGRHLLAHELAHTVQQGATKPLSSPIATRRRK